MEKSQYKTEMRAKRHNRLRHKISGTATRPRLAVFRSNKFVYAQLIDDETEKTLAAFDSRKETKGTSVTVPAGTFECLYAKIRDTKSSEEQIIKIVSIMIGTIVIVAGAATLMRLSKIMVVDVKEMGL